jgi:phthiocerol/phenolphthiocerol synthesis type-I polyketide synthase D
MSDDLPDGLPIGDALARWVAYRLGQTPDQVDRDRPVVEFGVSSVDAVELAGRLEQRLGRSLPATLLWEYPTINAIERALADGPASPGPAPQAGDAAKPRSVDAPPIAVVGVGCRFPGASGPQALWRLLLDRRDAVGSVPPGRWPRASRPGPPTSVDTLLAGAGRSGGFLDDVARFDAEFFGITPGEARLMDPQQRLVLEVAWEALAHAAVDPDRLAGSRTGVYLGICASEYAHLTTAALDQVEGWTATGGALSIAANRLSYLLDLRGPSLAVDTACSSSLVAIHLAARDLRTGETDLALAAGVNLLLDPALTVAFGRAGGLAAGGRCRPFDAGADGIVRGEGCGVVVLKRLPDALRDGDRVLALLLGGAVNSDGRSNGLVAPNPKAQEALLRQAYADAGCEPSTVDYVEAHGTGTALGDPIEAGALGAICGAGRQVDEQPLLIGSVKSHLGHLEAAAGVAGFITAVLALYHETVPPTINLTRANPHIPLADWRLRVAVEPEPLAVPGRPARAGVSGFGFGGTNAHLVLEAFPAVEAGPAGPARPAVCVVADRDLGRVRAQAATLARWLVAHPCGEPADVAGTLERRGERGPARAVVVARNRDELVAGLAAAGAGRAHPGTAIGSGRPAADAGVWVFSGYGGHWPGMGRTLLDSEPAFAQAVDELDPVFRAEVGLGLRDGLRSAADYPVAQAQPLIFGLQVALAALWRSYGVRPAAVIGHSMGEVAAAVVAGALAPADGVRLIARRAQLLSRVGPGAMAVVELSEDEFAAAAAGLSEVWVAVVAAPAQLVVTGAPAAVSELAARVSAGGRAARMVTTEGAGHSPAVDPLLPELRTALRDLRPGWPGLPFYSTVTATPPLLDADYWVANLRQPVRLADAVALAAADGYQFFLEISPHPVLVRPLGQTLAAAGLPDALVAASLRRHGPDAFATSLAVLCAHGHRPPTEPHRGPGRLLDLPAPPWRGERHWFDPGVAARPGPAAAPLPGEHVEVPGEDRHVWRLAGLGDAAHRLLRRLPGGVDALPLTGLVDLALAAAAQAGGVRPEQVEVARAGLEAGGAYQAETALTSTLTPVDGGGWDLAVHAPSAGGGWVRLGGAVLRRGVMPLPEPGPPPSTQLPVAPGPDTLAVCFAAVAQSITETTDPASAWFAVKAKAIQVGAGAVAGGQCWIWLDSPGGENRRTARLRLLDPAGAVVLAADGVELHRAGPDDSRPALLRELVEVRWREQALPVAGAPVTGPVTVLGAGDDALVAAVLADPAAPGSTRRADLAAGGDGVLVLIAPPADRVPDPAAARRLALSAIRAAATDTSGLWLVTRGGAAVGPAEAGRPDLAWVRGLVRTLAFEQPLTRAVWLDLDPASDPATQAARLWTELHAGRGDDEVAWRGEQRWAARLVPAPVPARRPGPPVRAGAAYVITGGYGGIGLRVAQWLAAEGAGRLVLAGRSGPPPGSDAVLDTLRRSGVDVRVVLGDIADEGVAARLVGTAQAGGVPLAGVAHAAGVLRDRLLAHVGPEDLAQVWAPKVDGAWRLHAAVAVTGVELDWWVSFSSAAALLGSPGQVAYAAANAWLDAFSRWQRSRGVPASAVNWGTWSQVGGATGVHLPGLDPVEPAEGIAALAGLLCREPGTVGVLRFDPAVALTAFPEAARLPFFAEVATGVGPPVWHSADQVRALPPAEALRLIGDRLAQRIAAVLGTDAAPPRDARLTDIGLDSLAAVRVKGLIEADFAHALPTSVLVGGATLADLETALAEALGVPVAAAARPAALGARDAAERSAMWLFETALGHAVPDIEWRLDDADRGAADRVVATTRVEYGVDVDLAALLADPTPRALAVPLRAAEQAEIEAAGPVRPLGPAGGARAPLFLAHPAGGSTHVYRQLVSLLGPDQPVYGLERFADGSVTERAARYVRLIRELYPTGPYRLGGWSFGGVLAFEMARQLAAAGEKVDSVLLLDSGLPVPVPPDEAARLLTGRFLGFVEYLRDTYQAPVEVDPDRLRELTEDEQFELVLGQMSAAGLTARLPPAVWRHQIDSHTDTRALDEYQAGPYPGPVTLYRSTQPTPWTVTDPRYEHPDAARGWDRFCTDLRIVPVTAHHLNLLDPPAVDVIAADLRRLL